MTRLNLNFLPDVPAGDEWKILISTAIAEAEDAAHVTVTAEGVTLFLHWCVYADGTPLWDHPLVGSSGTVTAVRRDGIETTIPLSDGHTWDQLVERLDAFMDGWAVTVAETLSKLSAADRAVRVLEKELQTAKAVRRKTARDARDAGITRYRMAQATKRRESSVALWVK